MRHIAFLFEFTALGCLAFAAATLILPFFVVLIVFVLCVAAESFRVRWRGGLRRRAVIGLTGSLIIMSTVLYAAATHQASKKTERLLSQQILLESPDMSLAEVGRYCINNRQQFPIRISLSFAEKRKNVIVRWPRRELSLREFLDSLEAQAGLQYAFMHCGNGTTLLHGGDCTFGLHVWDPDVTGPLREPEFDPFADLPSPEPQNNRMNLSDKASGA